TANLYGVGPRKTTLTKSANKLLNAITNRADPDRQHHFINLMAPKYADPSQPNLSEAADGTLTFRFAAVSDELPGTYTASLFAKSADDKDQIFPLVDFQIGIATREEYVSGPTMMSTCYRCHKAPGADKAYMHHIHPAPPRFPIGNYSIDFFPIGT